MACSGQPDQEVWPGAGSCLLSPVLAQNLPAAYQMGMCGQLGFSGQVVTFWSSVSLHVKSREHSPYLREDEVVGQESFIEC